ncbi:MAG: type VI secretion system baseplate subunit TssF [Planctomycetia bacterium]|nr:type VI secretion system baseplate subunit TssF [Planctomycetia bacterium]
MSDELLPYYSRELAFLREMGAGFADEHPKIARRLSWTGGESQDPHVERIIESVAFLNARIRHKLDDDFPEICGALIDVLYPHYQAPTPSMAIAKLSLDASQAGLADGYTLAAGAEMDTETGEHRCRFRTAYPVTAWPFKIESAALLPRPFTGPQSPLIDRAAAVLKIELSTLAPTIPLATFSCPRLRLFLHGAAAQQNVHALYELIFNHTLEIVIEGSGPDKPSLRLSPQSLRPVGFELNEGLLNYPARSFPGYRLLTEYFAFPEKFLFVDLADLDFQRWVGLGNHKATIHLLLDRSSPDLERTVGKSTFHLGCTPIVNLYRQAIDPFRLTQLATEYRLVPDARNVQGTEIYSVDQVAATLPDGQRTVFHPFFGARHAVPEHEARAYWYASRRPSAAKRAGEFADKGTEVFLTFVNLDPALGLRDDYTVDVEATLLNRDLPHQLPFGGGQPRMSLFSAPNTVVHVECLTRMTKTRRPPPESGRLWRLISHLSLNHLSLADSAEGLDALREILTLYNFTGEQDAKDRIAGVVGLSSKPVVDRAPGVRGGFRRGTELKLSFDETKYIASGCYLLACVLDRFFGLYCTMNSFSRLVAVTTQRESKGDIWRWPSRAGSRALI